ncbi:MAG: M14 family zinc carboxypeptidase [Phycisphaerales bacterium]
MSSSLLGRAGIAVALLSLVGTGVSSGQEGAGRLDAPVASRPYEGVRLVEVMPATREQFDQAVGVARDVWTHRPGPGLPLELLVDESGEAALQKLGLTTTTLVADVQGAVDAQMADVRRRAHERGLSWFENYKTNAEIRTYVDALAVAHADLATSSVFGTSLQGRDMYMITITGPDAPGNLGADRPVVIFNGCQHAREWISPMTVTYFADQLLETYDTDARVRALVDNVRIVLAPMINPDGYEYTWSNERLWRKNRRGGYGVDLNRNWGYEWGGDGSSGFTGDETYHGSAPFSEPETQALRDLAISYGDKLAAHIDYHSFSQLILWPFGYANGVQTPEPDRTRFDELAMDMSATIQSVNGAFYTPEQSIDLYAAAGASCDWFYGELGATSFAIELRDTGNFGFLLPANQILPTAEENFAAMLLFLERTTQLLSVSLAVPTPAYVQAGQPYDLEVQALDGVATLDPSSVELHARVGGAGAFSTSSATPLGGSLFQVTLPAAPCGDDIEFYVTADTTEAQTITFPAGGESEALSTTALEISVVLNDDFETDQGWTVSGNISSAAAGRWERAIPVGGGDRGDPPSDADGSGRCYVTGAADGNTDVDDGSTILTSPTLDLSASPEAAVSYWRWYNNSAGASPNEDTFVVEISSNNGASWTTLETVGPSGPETAGGWYLASFRVADYVSATSAVRVRFTASDLGSGSVVEAGVDGFRVEETGCSGPMACNEADLGEPFGQLDFTDVVAFLGAFAGQQAEADLAAPFGQWDFSDVVSFLGAFGGGCP